MPSRLDSRLTNSTLNTRPTLDPRPTLGRPTISQPTVVTPPVRPGVLDPNVVVRPTQPLPPPTPHITLRNTGRPPSAQDLIIKRTFDGLTPEAAENTIKAKLQGTVAPQHRALVDSTVTARVRDMQVALNNVFTPGTPNRQFLDGKQPASITVIGSLSNSNPIVYEVTQPGKEPRYYSRGWSGGFAELPKAPAQVVMRAQVTLEPRGLRMDYPAWKNSALAG